MDLKQRDTSRLRPRRLYPYVLALALAVALATSLTVSSPVQSGGTQHGTFTTAVSKNSVDLDLRSASRFLRDEPVGQVLSGPETPPTSSPSLTGGKNPLRGPNMHVNDPGLDKFKYSPASGRSCITFRARRPSPHMDRTSSPVTTIPPAPRWDPTRAARD